MRISIFSIIIISVLVSAFIARANMASTNFEIQWDSVGVTGADTSESTNYKMRDTSGNSSIGRSSSTNYQVSSGYRAGIFDQIITFDVFAQNNSSERAVTNLSGNVISCSVTSLTVGDFIALVQDKGQFQVSAIGKIKSIGIGTITIDELKNGGIAPVIDGTNDYLYLLSGYGLSLGDIKTSEISTGIIGFNVNADLKNGYVVQVSEDGDLRNGALTIDSVSDGSVSTGSEEYGARSSDSSLLGSTFDTQDSAFTTDLQNIASQSQKVFSSRNFLTLKASIAGITENASYGHLLTFIISGNY